MSPNRLPPARSPVHRSPNSTPVGRSRLVTRCEAWVGSCEKTAELLGVSLSVSPAIHLAGLGVCLFFVLHSLEVPGAGLCALGLVSGVVFACHLAVPKLSRRRCENLLPELCWGAAHLVNAGVPLRGSVIQAIGDLPDPQPTALRELSLALRYGETLRSALGRLDLTSSTIRFVVDCLIICEDVGGDVGAAMSLTSDALRSRTEAHSAAKNRLVQARASIAVLLALPILGTAVVASMVEAAYATGIAQASAAGGALALALGSSWSHRIVKRLR